MADAVARCITHAIDKIDLSHPKCNPFSYITQTAYNVFRQRIKNEKKYQQAKEQMRDRFFDEYTQVNGLHNKITPQNYDDGCGEQQDND